MRTIAEIRSIPTTSDKVGASFDNAHPLHESVFRSYQILERVKWLLENGARANIVLAEIDEMETE